MTLPMEKSYQDAHASSAPITFGKSDNGNTQIAVEFVIDSPDYAGETITWVGHFTDKTAARTIESLQIAGWRGDDISELDGVPGSEALPDAVSLTCEGEEYNGEWTVKVRWVNRPGGPRFKFKEQISGSELKAFGAQLRATVKSVKASGGAPRSARQDGGGGSRAAAPPRHPNAPPVSDDDIPFISASLDVEPTGVARLIRFSL